MFTSTVSFLNISFGFNFTCTYTHRVECNMWTCRQLHYYGFYYLSHYINTGWLGTRYQKSIFIAWIFITIILKHVIFCIDIYPFSVLIFGDHFPLKQCFCILLISTSRKHQGLRPVVKSCHTTPFVLCWGPWTRLVDFLLLSKLKQKRHAYI